MANRQRPTHLKRERERAKREKREQKAAKRQAAKERRDSAQPREGAEDPDIAGIVPGPQPSPWEEDELA
jgi:hypothetical protein